MTHSFSRLWALLSRVERKRFAGLLMVLVVVAAIEVAGVASIMPFMAVVSNPDVIHSNRFLQLLFDFSRADSDRGFLVLIGMAVLGLLLLGNLLKAMSLWLRLRLTHELHRNLSVRLLGEYASRPYSFFVGSNSSDLAKNVLQEVTRVITGVVSPLLVFASSTLVALAILGLLLLVDPIVAAVVGAVLCGAYGSIYLLSRRRLASIGEGQVIANSQRFKTSRELFGSIKEVKLSGRAGHFMAGFDRAARTHADTTVSVRLIADLPRFLLETVAFGGILVVAISLVALGRAAHELVALLALYAFAGYRLLPALQQSFDAATTLKFSLPSLDILYRDLHAAEGSAESAESAEGVSATAPLRFECRVELHDVSFRYEGAAEDTLKEINLSIERGDLVGIVGPTGSGKSTLVDVLLGLLSPSVGSVLLDGVPVTSENLVEFQRNFGYVPQQIYLTDDTIMRNIAFGLPDSKIDADAVRRAARIANIERFIDDELPAGFQTVVGEQGIRLSGGQRQRIGIARALYSDPAILVMDEATSAMDGLTEEQVMEAVTSISRLKTIVLIAHRLSTVRGCDVIYLLEGGRIRTHGDFESLMQDSPWFRAAVAGARLA